MMVYFPTPVRYGSHIATKNLQVTRNDAECVLLRYL